MGRTVSSTPPPADPSLTRMQARPENTRHIRHADLMRRWPVLAEPWAQKIAAAHEPAANGGRRRDDRPGPLA